MSASFGTAAPTVVDRYGPSVGDVLERFEIVCGPLETAREEDYPARLCLAAAQVLAFDSVGISITLDGEKRIPVAASSPETTIAESLEFTLGAGPCMHASVTNRPVLVPDISDVSSKARSQWPAYAEQMLDRTPYRAVFALPLTAGGMSIGTVSLYRELPGMVDFTELGDALAVTNRIFYDLLDSGTFGGALQPSFRWLNMPLARIRGEVWQAIGKATVEKGMNSADALSLLRAYSHKNGLLLDEVAADIIAYRLNLDQLES